MAHVISWTDVAEVSTGAGIKKRTLQGTNASLTMVTVAAGLSAPKQDHAHEQFVQVLAGRGMLETEEGRRRFGPGDVFHFPANTWHSATFEIETILVETNMAR